MRYNFPLNFSECMKAQKSTLYFILQSVIAGLAIAFLILFLYPNFLSNKKPQPTNDSNGVASYADAVQSIAPSVVSIYAQGEVLRGKKISPELQKFMGLRSLVPETVKQQYLGSGVILTNDGYIVTNFHVVQYASQIMVALWGGQLLEAKIIGSDQVTDLAILKVEAVGLTPAVFADSDKTRIGDVVMAIGNPYGLSQTVTSGIISAKGRSGLDVSTIEDFIQTDAAINIGNSGGALINTLGQVVGISTASFTGAQGINFAIPSNSTLKIMKEILNKGRVLRGWLGLELYSSQLFYRSGLIQPDKGVVVWNVYPDSPGFQARLKNRDIITHINDVEVRDNQHYREIIALSKPNELMTLKGFSSGRPFTVEIRTQERPKLLRRY